MSTTLPIAFDLAQACQQLVTGAAQAADVAALMRHCADILDVVVPSTHFEVRWAFDGSYRSLGSSLRDNFTLPDARTIARLHAGVLILHDTDTSLVPLLLRGDVRGWLHLAATEFTSDQTSALMLLCGVLTPAIATLVTEATNTLRIKQLRALNEIGRVLSSELRSDALPAIIYEGVCRVLDAPIFCIAAYEAAAHQFRMLLSITGNKTHPAGGTWSASRGLAGVMAQQRTPIRTDHYVQECQKQGIAPETSTGELHDTAWMGVPLLLQDRVLGIIVVGNFDPHASYSNDDLELLQTIAAQASIALANAHLYERAERQTRQVDSLNRIGRSISSTLDPERVPSLIMHHIQELLDAEEGSLLLLDRASDELVFAYAGGPTGNQLIGQRMPRGKGIAGHVFNTGQSTIVNNVRADGRFYADTDSRTGFTTSSLLAAPLRGVSGMLGVMEVINKRDGRPFTEEDRRLIDAAADQAVIALENAQRFAQVDQALAQRVREIDQTNRQLHEILYVGNALRAERSLDGVLRSVVDAISKSTGFRSAVIALVHRQQTQQPYLRRVATAGSAALQGSLASTANAPLADFEALLRPEFQCGPATYLIDHRYGDYFALWGGEDQQPLFSQWPVLAHGWNPRDVLLTVLLDSSGQLIGFLRVYEPETESLPSPEQVQMLEIFANQAAVAIENARLYEELQHGLHSLMTLNDLGMALNGMRHAQQEIFKLTATSVVEITGALEAYVLGHDDTIEGPGLLEQEPLVHIGTSDHSLPFVRLCAQQAITTGHPDLRVLEAAASPEEALFLNGMARALVSIPLRATQHTLGALCVCYRDLPSAADIETLTLFATQAAAAAESMHLWDALSRGRDQLASIMASARDGMLLLGSDGYIAVANDALHQLCSISPLAERASLQAFLDAWQANANYPEGEWQLLQQGLNDVALGVQEITRGQLNQLTPRARSLEWAVVPAHGTGESHGGQLLVVHDITDAKETERLRQDLTNMIVHDMRSPIASVMTSIDLLFKGVSGELTDKQRSVLTIAYNSANQMLDMVGLMLDISRLEAGRMPLNCMPTPFHALVQRATTRISAIARDRQIIVQNDFPSELPLVYADSDLIARVLQNLLDNALKFSGKGGTIVVRATVVEQVLSASDHTEPLAATQPFANEESLFTIDPSRQVLVSVSDQGVGIAPADQEKIFDKFSQVGERRGGSGLGLTFCKLVAENHGGTIGVHSALGAGSTFFFTLPIVTL